MRAFGVWRRKKRYGRYVTCGRYLFFYAVKEPAAQQVAEALRKWGLRKVEVRAKRTLWILKGWVITGVEEGTWALEKLQDRTRRYSRLADILRVTYDGCGAMMPDNDAPEPGAAPNGGPATPFDNSGVTAGPPSVS